jgi:hypothetical protein
VLLCCKGCAGFVVNATAIIPQTDEALRILFAVRFGVRNRLLNIDFRLRWCVNGSHLSLSQLRASRSQIGAWPRSGNAIRASTPCSPYLADAAGLVRQQEIYARIQSASFTGT